MTKEELIRKLAAENETLKKEIDILKREILYWQGEYHLQNQKYWQSVAEKDFERTKAKVNE